MRFAIAALLAIGATATSLNSQAQTQVDAMIDYDDLTEGQANYVDEIFDETDVNDNDEISFDEVSNLLLAYGTDISGYPRWLRRWIFRGMDRNRDGSLDLEEALDVLYRYAPEALDNRDGYTY